MSEGSQVSKVTLCFKILKWQSVTESLTDQGQVPKYRAPWAAKELFLHIILSCDDLDLLLLNLCLQ